jgi:hypothetical protein
MNEANVNKAREKEIDESSECSTCFRWKSLERISDFHRGRRARPFQLACLEIIFQISICIFRLARFYDSLMEKAKVIGGKFRQLIASHFNSINWKVSTVFCSRN